MNYENKVSVYLKIFLIYIKFLVIRIIVLWILLFSSKANDKGFVRKILVIGLVDGQKYLLKKIVYI